VFRQIRWQLVGWSIGVLALILALAGAAVYVILAHSLVADVDRELATRADLAAARLIERPGDSYQFPREGYLGGWFYMIVDRDGNVLVNPQRVSLATLPLEQFPDASPVYLTAEYDDWPMRIYLTALPPRGEEPVALAVGKSLLPEYETLRQVLLVLLLAGAVGVALSCGGAWFLASRALVPIEAALRRQQEFVADASHELRTPLTVLRSATDLLDRHRAEPLQANGDLFDDVRQEIARLERQTVDLLTLARSDLGELQLALGLVDAAGREKLAAAELRRFAAERRPVLAAAPTALEVDPERYWREPRAEFARLWREFTLD
jgi:signal transduction histidine kinase